MPGTSWSYGPNPPAGLEYIKLTEPSMFYRTSRYLRAGQRAPGRGGMKGAVPRRVNVTTAEAVLRAMGYRVYRETFDLVAVRHLDNGKRFHVRIEAHGEPIVPRGAEIDVHIDYPVERGRGHRSRAESEGIAIEMEALLDSIKRAKPSRDAPGFMACPTCGKEMASHLFDAHLKLTHQ